MIADSTPMSGNLPIEEAIEHCLAVLGRTVQALTALKNMLVPTVISGPVEFDPRDPANKKVVGGLNKLTDHGIEVCYRLFDQGKSRNAVASLMDISFGAANHRLKAWTKAGGHNRAKRPL